MAFFPLGLGGFVLGWGDIVQGRASLHWPRADGVVLSAELEENFFGAAQPNIRYEFAYNGQSYVSTRLWPGVTLNNMPFLTGSASRRFLLLFPTGQKIKVAVNPKNPRESALIPGPVHHYHWMLVFGFFVLLGLWSPLGIIWNKIAQRASHAEKQTL